MTKENMLQRALRRLASSNAELESEDLQKNVRDEGAVPIQSCEDRQQVSLTGHGLDDHHRAPGRSPGPRGPVA